MSHYYEEELSLVGLQNKLKVNPDKVEVDMLISVALDLIGTDEIAKLKFYAFYINNGTCDLKEALTQYIENVLK